MPIVDPLGYAKINSQKFETFLALIESQNIDSWMSIAEAVGVSRKTIYEWRKHPQAQLATSRAIAKCIRKMEEVGADDWKMWRERLTMLGVTKKESVEVEDVTDLKSELDKLDEGQQTYEDYGRTAQEQVVADDTLVQNQG